MGRLSLILIVLDSWLELMSMARSNWARQPFRALMRKSFVVGHYIGAYSKARQGVNRGSLKACTARDSHPR